MKQKLHLSRAVKPKKTHYVLLFLFLASAAYLFFIGRYETIYGLGVYTFIAVQMLGLVIFLIATLIQRRKTGKNLRITAVLLCAIQLFFIAAHHISTYTPTYTIRIPADFEGCVYLFTTPHDRGNVQVDENGIGYVGSKGKCEWELEQGGKIRTSLLANSQSNELLLYEDQGRTMISYSIWCFQIESSERTEASNVSSNYDPCMDEVEFVDWLKTKRVDELKLEKRVWLGNGNAKDWTPDPKRSRIHPDFLKEQ